MSTAAPTLGLPDKPDPVTTPQSYADLTKTASDQAAAEVKAQTDPLQNQIGSLQTKEGTAGSEIQDMFSKLLPQVQGSATALENFQTQAQREAQNIFQAAGQRLNVLSQNRAAEAQQLSQQIGGPVATGEFTQSTDPYESAFTAEGAGGMLHSLGIGSAGATEAETFAGQVFPAMQTEQVAKSNATFNDQIKSIQDRIDQLNASKGGLATDKLNTLLANERDFELKQQSLALDKQKAAHDWSTAQQTLSLEEKRLAYEKGNATGVIDGKPTVQAIKDNQAFQLESQRLGIDSQRLALAVSKFTESSAVAQQRLDIQASKNAMSAIDAAFDPTKGKPVTLTVKQTLAPQESSGLSLASVTGKVPANTYYDPKTNTWYRYQKLTLTPQQWAARGGPASGAAITDPNRLYDIAISQGAQPANAENMVRAKTGLQDWKPGQSAVYTADALKGQSLDELKGIAMQRGWNNVGKSTRGALTDFILARNPKG